MDYYFNSGGSGNAPYSNYISNAREQSQKFAIGKTYVTIDLSVNTLMAITATTGPGSSGENNLHTADGGSYGSGDDVQYTGNGTITLTFATAVSNVKFSIYDVDRQQRIQFAAADGATPRSISLSLVSGSILSFNNNNSTTARVDASNTTVANTSTDGTVNVDIAGPVTTITLTVSNAGTCTSGCGTGGVENPANYWLSDIQACVPGTFPVNYHQLSGAPFTGPGGNQPEYFIATPDTDSVFMVDPATGRAKFLFRDEGRDYVNSFAYDPIHHVMYYISENNSVDANNKMLKRYNFNTKVIDTVIADVSAAPLNIPTFNMGIESAGAAFYDGALYFGVEGGQTGSSTRESIIWRIDFDVATGLIPVNAYQVWATPSYDNDGSPSFHDWGDFLIKDGVLFNFNTARSSNCNTCYAQSKYHQYNMTTGAGVVYTNPLNTVYSGQGGLTYSGAMYFLRDSVGRYFENGTVDAPAARRNLVIVQNQVSSPLINWFGGTGDASDPFRPKSDFGDAPASYDGAGSPAVHDYDTALTLGSNFDDEWEKTGSTALANSDGVDEDALSVTPIFTHSQNGYDVFIRAINRTGAVARIVAWIDFNNNGTFEASEGITRTINHGTGLQNVHLQWSGMPSIPAGVTGVFMRIRIASNAALTTSTPNGWFSNGEVEDYLVQVDDILPVTLRNFSATAVDGKVKVNWNTTNEQGMKDFVVERSKDGVDWEAIATVDAKGSIAGTTNYNYHDEQPYIGNSYYRLQMRDKDGRAVFSDARKVSLSTIVNGVRVSPNPFKDIISVKITLLNKESVKLKLLNQSGNVILRKSVNAQEGLNTIELTDVSKLPSGIYILEITTSAEVKREKILKK